MKNVFALMFVFCVLMTGCGSLGKGITNSASGKNLGLDGYMMYGTLETSNPDTFTPENKLIIGRVSYKSRKVGIPADQKVPNTGNFKAAKTKSLFGTEEMIMEYDWTAGSDKDAATAEKRLQEMAKKAKEAMDGNKTPESGAGSSGASGGAENAK